MRPETIGHRLGRGPLGTDDEERLIRDLLKGSLGRARSSYFCRGRRQRPQLLLVPVGSGEISLSLLLDQNALGDVVMSDNRIDSTAML